MENYPFKIYISAVMASLFACMLLFSSCEKNLDNVTFTELTNTNYFKTEKDATSAVSAAYTGMTGRQWSGGVGASYTGWAIKQTMTTDEGKCKWGTSWDRLKNLDYDSDFDWVTGMYYQLMPVISQITTTIDKIQGIPMDEALKKRYVAELKGLRGYYAQILFNAYGPVPIRTVASEVNNPDASIIPRPTNEEMVNLIAKDYTEAALILPEKFTASDYGRISKAACYIGLMKLYMHEKRWTDAIDWAQKIEAIGFSLTGNYEDNFSIKAKGGNSEIIFSLVCTAAGSNDFYTNRWLAHALPGDYIDPAGAPVSPYGGGYSMPWGTYDKFDGNDKRLKVLLRNYPVGKKADGTIIYRDARTNPDLLGAVPVKYTPDAGTALGDKNGLDIPIYRYADVLLMWAEAINEKNGGPDNLAYTLINKVRTRAGLPNLTVGLSKVAFLAKIQDERLFELWGEGVRRDDLIRWNLLTQKATESGSTTAQSYKTLYPLPRTVVVQSNGVIKQNPGYN